MQCQDGEVEFQRGEKGLWHVSLVASCLDVVDFKSSTVIGHPVKNLHELLALGTLLALEEFRCLVE